MLNFNNSSSWVHVGEVIRMLLFLESATEPSARCHRRSSSMGNLGEKECCQGIFDEAPVLPKLYVAALTCGKFKSFTSFVCQC